MTKEAIDRFFAKRPKCKEFWLVGEMIFLNQDRATGIANGKTVEHIVKQEQETEEQETGKPDTEEPATEEQETGKPDTEPTLDEAKALVKATVFEETTDYFLMKKLVKALNLQTDHQSKADYITALNNFKQENGAI